MHKYLVSENAWIRFISLLSVTLSLFVIAWVIGYYLLPEGFLRGKFAGAALAGETAAESLTKEFFRIAVINLVMLAPILAGNWVFKHKEIPLGYAVPVLWGVIYALIIGTNSTTIPMPERMAPSLQVLTRSGLYEIGAYALAAAATYGISAYRVIRFYPPESEKIMPAPRLLYAIHWPALATAILLLMAANLWEAYQIVRL